MTSPAEIVVERRDDRLVARLSGEVDMSNATYVREQLLASMPNEASGLVLDIAGCRYLDSAAIEVLFDLSRRLARFLHGTGASDTEHYELTLTICEAAGNAIEHAYGPGDATYEVDVTFDGDEVVATVRDFGSWRAKRGEHRGRGLRIIEELMDEVSVERHDRGTSVTMRRRVGAERAA